MKNNVFLKMSRSILALSMALGITVAAQAQQGLFVKSSTGTITPFSYTSVSKLTFVNEVMTTVSPKGVAGQSFALSTVASVSFGNVSISGVKETFMNETDVKLYPTVASSTINLQGATDGAQISIYSITGSKMMQLNVTSNLQAINVSGFKSGIYLLRVNGQTLKFSKK